MSKLTDTIGTAFDTSMRVTKPPTAARLAYLRTAATVTVEKFGQAVGDGDVTWSEVVTVLLAAAAVAQQLHVEAPHE